MRFATLVLLLIARQAICEEVAKPIPKRYLPFQGRWQLVSAAVMDPKKDKNEKVPEVFVTVTGTSFELSGDGITEEFASLEFAIPATKRENPFRALQKRGAEKIDDIVDVKNQIVVFWTVGVFELSGDKLRLALKYCGQGLEGEHFRIFVLHRRLMRSRRKAKYDIR